MTGPCIDRPLRFSSLNQRALMQNSWCPDSESNQGHGDFQSPALPTELSGQRAALNRIGRFSSMDLSEIYDKPRLIAGFSGKLTVI